MKAASAARAWQVPNQNLQTSGVTNVVSEGHSTADRKVVLETVSAGPNHQRGGLVGDGRAKRR